MLGTNVDKEKFETLIEINTKINSDFTDIKTLLTDILESATQLTEGEASSLLLLNPENNRLYFEIALGAKGHEVKKFSLNIGEGIAGWVAQHNRSLIVNDTDADQRFLADIGKQIGYKTESILAVPMQIKDKCVGVIEMLNKRNGKYFDQSDLEWLEIFATQAALAIQNARYLEKVRSELSNLKDQLSNEQNYHTLIYKSSAIEEKLTIVKRIAATDSSVLILGESGVGKELFAEQVHLNSPRKGMPFIRINCAALPEELLESELFGHEKGAFTDAISTRRGRFELADGGTIFLDEIGEITPATQSKLLRVLQHQTFERLGSSEAIHVNVRIIAATNRDIEQMVEDGTFRQDLYYRLNVLPLFIPPLRQRIDDIEVLADFFLTRCNKETKKQIKGFSPEAMEVLLSYPWPGNVRELENSIERAVVFCNSYFIQPGDLSLGNGREKGAAAYEGRSLKDAINIFKKNIIIDTLRQNNGNQTVTAQKLGIQRTYLSRLINELNITRQGDY